MIQNQANPLICDLDFNQLQDHLNQWGQEQYRARQIWSGLYKNYQLSPDEMTVLPKALREMLGSKLEFNILRPIKRVFSTNRSTEKVLFSLHDGHAIESVLMQYRNRISLCISTQAGCAMGCVFCATGQMGFKRNLSHGEIIAQVLYFSSQLTKLQKKLTNIVIMGMGEPFHNYEATLAAVDRLNDPTAVGLGERRFTISTVGIIPKIKKFAEEQRQINLAVSLHAADDQLRSSLLPINKKYPLDELLEICRYYTRITNRRITFEWALIENVNDMDVQAHLLSTKIKGMLCHVNLIPLNESKGYKEQATPLEKANNFKEILQNHHIPCTIRSRKGIDIAAGCGQLMDETIK